MRAGASSSSSSSKSSSTTKEAPLSAALRRSGMTIQAIWAQQRQGDANNASCRQAGAAVRRYTCVKWHVSDVAPHVKQLHVASVSCSLLGVLDPVRSLPVWTQNHGCPKQGEFLSQVNGRGPGRSMVAHAHQDYVQADKQGTCLRTTITVLPLCWPPAVARLPCLSRKLHMLSAPNPVDYRQA